MAGLVIYPCPLGDGRFAELRLPVDLTASDAKRIAAYIQALLLTPTDPATEKVSA